MLIIVAANGHVGHAGGRAANGEDRILKQHGCVWAIWSLRTKSKPSSDARR